ncbi:hypothetical protein Pla163_31070 [Planctomycetes bacterium Pla163]|uniref:Uncharacterized protein n=1 Tax=Rohdeia mirabilis TaxID=2528008 RepID=A0A518D3A2_9BACT|nr:hypothetical protein Pla163_31070 [Planctomycetes bacterium Pla163]
MNRILVGVLFLVVGITAYVAMRGCSGVAELSVVGTDEAGATTALAQPAVQDRIALGDALPAAPDESEDSRITISALDACREFWDGFTDEQIRRALENAGHDPDRMLRLWPEEVALRSLRDDYLPHLESNDRDLYFFIDRAVRWAGFDLPGGIESRYGAEFDEVFVRRRYGQKPGVEKALKKLVPAVWAVLEASMSPQNAELERLAREEFAGMIAVTKKIVHSQDFAYSPLALPPGSLEGEWIGGMVADLGGWAFNLQYTSDDWPQAEQVKDDIKERRKERDEAFVKLLLELTAER